MTDRAASSRPEGALYYEVQFMRQWWLWALLLGGLTVMVVLPFFPFEGSQGIDTGMVIVSAFSAILMLGLMLGMWLIRLKTWVKPDGIHVSYWPMIDHQLIPWQQLDAFQAVKYRPILEYGGWGMRIVGRKKKAYNASGNRGVQLWFEDGSMLLLGSQRDRELESAIAAASKKSPGAIHSEA